MGVTKKEKAEANRRRKQSIEVEEEEEENRDWWTKYFASLEAVAIVGVVSCLLWFGTGLLKDSVDYTVDTVGIYICVDMQGCRIS